MMVLSADKCPPDTVKLLYEFWIGLICGGNDKVLIIPPNVLSTLL